MTTDEKNENDIRLQLLLYHQKQMTGRRSIEFKAFLSLIGLYIISIKGIIEISSANIIDNLDGLKIFSIIILFILYFIFLGFLRSIERKSAIDRQMYNAHSKYFSSLFKMEPEIKRFKWEWMENLFTNWAESWPRLAAFIINVIICYLIWQLK